METAAYISNLLRNDVRLFSAIYDFNNGILEYIHPDFSSKIPVAALRPLLASSRSLNEALSYIRSILGIADLGEYNFSSTRFLLCLFSAEEIRKIICYIGGICFSEQIRKIILGRELLKIKHSIGNDAYLFSIRNASLFIKSNMAESFQAEGSTLVERIFNTGRSLIEMALLGAPNAILKRFRLKFPKDFGWDFNRSVDDPDYYFGFIKKVVKRALSESNNVAVSIVKG